jgi:hypothetical protein
MGAQVRVPEDRHHGVVERVCNATLEGPGYTDPALRRSVALYAGQVWSSGNSDVEISDSLSVYVEKVAIASYKVVDEDFTALRDSVGLSEDEILEITLAAALGCALAALETGTGLAEVG